MTTIVKSSVSILKTSLSGSLTLADATLKVADEVVKDVSKGLEIVAPQIVPTMKDVLVTPGYFGYGCFTEAETLEEAEVRIKEVTLTETREKMKRSALELGMLLQKTVKEELAE